VGMGGHSQRRRAPVQRERAQAALPCREDCPPGVATIQAALSTPFPRAMPASSNTPAPSARLVPHPTHSMGSRHGRPHLGTQRLSKRAARHPSRRPRASVAASRCFALALVRRAGRCRALSAPLIRGRQLLQHKAAIEQQRLASAAIDLGRSAARQLGHHVIQAGAEGAALGGVQALPRPAQCRTRAVGGVSGARAQGRAYCALEVSLGQETIYLQD
jgi:hypothetical protein